MNAGAWTVLLIGAIGLWGDSSSLSDYFAAVRREADAAPYGSDGA